jgi:hypothetical protein
MGAMGSASRSKQERRQQRQTTAELLDQLADLLKKDAGTLPQALQGLLDRGVTMGADPPPPPPPEDCPGCKMALELGKKQGMPAQLGRLILGALHQHRHAAMAPTAVPVEMLPALAMAKGLATTTTGAWRVVLQHLEQHFLLSCQLTQQSSTAADWRQLGTIVSQLGAPDEPLVPFEKLPPDHAITWRWPAPLGQGGLAPDVGDAN